MISKFQSEYYKKQTFNKSQDRRYKIKCNIHCFSFDIIKGGPQEKYFHFGKCNFDMKPNIIVFDALMAFIR